MILKIYDNDNKIYPYTDIDDTFFVTESYGGLMYLQWDMSPDHPLYPLIYEEIRVEYEEQLYLIKGINERKTVVTVNCELDLTGLQENIWTEFKKTKESFYNVCREIMANTGWSVVDAELVAPRRSLELTDVTSLDILNHCTNSTSYGVTYRFDTKNKKIYIIKPQNDTTPTGVYFTDELNLSDLTYKGSTGNLITRLYPIGKDGLNISSVNGGKKYIDNFSYTNKIVTNIWRDERYTNVQELFDDATVKLAAMAVPEQSYTCKINDLAKQKPEEYDVLSFKLYDVITLIDRKRKRRVNHRIVEYKRYPTNSSLNTVTLSTIAGTVTGKINAINTRITELNAATLHDRTKINEIKQDLDTTVLHISESWTSSVNESLFTQTAEGIFLEVNKLVGMNRWSTLVQQSATDVQIAWNNCSNYIKFENSQINIYDSDNDKIMSINHLGQNFYYQGNYIGKTGTNGWAGNKDFRGIIFQLDYSGAYMTWSWRDDPDATTSLMKWSYVPKAFGNFKNDDTLYAGCDVDLMNNELKNVLLSNFYFKGGSINGTLEFVAVININSDGSPKSWKNVKMVFENGILKSATW